MTIIFAGLFATILCLGLQAFAVAVVVRYINARPAYPTHKRKRVAMFHRFSVLMLVLMGGNICQALIWAVLYWLLGAIADFETALYFSGVTFTSLGYGDVVLEPYTRLLGPLQAANGLMMFGITTAVFIAAVQFNSGKPKSSNNF